MRILSVVCAFIATACAFQSQPVAHAEQEILDAESRLAEALNALDDAALDRLWDEHLVFTAPNGHTSTKAQRLKIVRDARATASGRVTSTNDDVRVQLVGTAAIAYVVSSWHGMDAAPSQPYRATHVWVRENGAWRLVAAHVSKVAP